MTKYDDNNKGVLFHNDDKTDDRQPDYKGNINVNGEAFWLNAWVRESKNGLKYRNTSLPRPIQ